MLEIQNLQKRYGDLLTLDGVGLSVQQGEVVSLVGASGCGKSTLLRIAAGLDSQFSGRVAVQGQTVTAPSPAVGVVFQEPRLMPWLTVARNIAFGVEGLRQDDPRVQAVATQVGLGDFLGALPRQLSGGMAQRCAIARALIAGPRLLLLDEPFSALDAFIRMSLQDLLLDIARTRGTTMMLVTHDIDEALYVSDRVLVMTCRPGRVQTEVQVRLGRPRDRRDARLASLRVQILTELMPPAGALGELSAD